MAYGSAVIGTLSERGVVHFLKQFVTNAMSSGIAFELASGISLPEMHVNVREGDLRTVTLFSTSFQSLFDLSRQIRSDHT
jgi:hypothetical protein